MNPLQDQPPAGTPPASPSQATPQFSYNAAYVRSILGNDGPLELVFRIGFATIFLTNAWTSLADPSSFLRLIDQNILGHLVGHYELQLYLIALNDSALGLLILSGYKKRLVYAWAGAWLLIVTFFKITSLL